MFGNKIIDLTMPINNQMSGVSIRSAKNLSKDGWNANTLELYSHSGTHMDAPIHFAVNPQTIDQIPLNRLISKAWVINVTNVLPREEILISHLGKASELFKAGDSLLLHSGWSKRIGSASYRNELPRISKELAIWCGEKKVNVLGVEPPSVADVNNLAEVTEIHHILMKNDVLIVEGLTNLQAISTERVTLIALPLKIEDGDGAPARILAIED